MCPARIMIVENEITVARELEAWLTRMGYDVAALAATAEDASRAVVETSPDLVLMGIVLKGEQSGIDAAIEIFSRYRIPIIYLGADADEKTLEQAKLAEPVGYIVKPFTQSELRASIEIGLHKHQAQRNLEKAERWLLATINSISDGLITADTQGKIIMMNPVAQALTGWEPSEAAGRDIGEVFNVTRAPGPAQDHPQARALPDENTIRHNGEVWLRARDGRSIPIDEALSPIRDHQGNLAGTVFVFQDVTERKQRERELEAISVISAALRNAGSREAIQSILLDQSLSLLTAEAAMLVMVDPLASQLARGAWAQNPEAGGTSRRQISAQVIAAGRPYVNNAIGAETRGERGRPAEACVPIISQQNTLGALWIARRMPIGEADLRLLTAIADIAGIAIQRSSLHEKTGQGLRRLNALRTIDVAISSSLDLRVTLSVVVEQIVTHLGIDAAVILLLNPHTQTLEYAAGQGLRGTGVEASMIRVGQGYAGRAVLERRTVIIPDLSAEQHWVRKALLATEDFHAYVGVPLIAKAQVKGILEIFHRSVLTPEAEWLGFLEALAGQAAIAIDNLQLFESLQRTNVQLTLAYDTTLEGWSRALDLRDKETQGHTWRVAELTVRLAQAMDLREEEIHHVRRGALLHDIGKMGVPDSILLKPGPLTDAEWAVMRKHPEHAFDLLAFITYLRPALDIPYCHHEKWDGTGYPRGLKGEQIPLAARIFAVVDVWDALCSQRPYRSGWPPERAREYILTHSGRHFDPKVVETFMRTVPVD